MYKGFDENPSLGKNHFFVKTSVKMIRFWLASRRKASRGGYSKETFFESEKWLTDLGTCCTVVFVLE